MPRYDSPPEERPPVVSSGRRPALFSMALVLVGLGCVVLALTGITESKPRELAYGSDYQPKLTAVYADTVDQPGPAPLSSTPDAPVTTEEPTGRAQARPARGVEFGALIIPRLQRMLPIVEGTDSPQLDRGVGHFERSAMPGAASNCVLSGHRDTVFADLGEVGVGDQLIVWTMAGEFTYEVRQVRIVDKDDKTVIVPTDHAVLTVTTCYPFRYVGAARDRYVLVADLVDRN
jgi:sortase A